MYYTQYRSIYAKNYKKIQKHVKLMIIISVGEY